MIVGAAAVPVVIDFWATWCPPCIAIGRTLEEMAPRYAGKALFVKCNVEVAVEIATRFGVRGLPHIAVIKGGQVVDTKLGNQNKAALEKLIAAYVP